MRPTNIIDIVNFIKGKQEPKLVVESADHAGPLAEVIFESKVLYDMLHGDYSLDEIVEQISNKNVAAKRYEDVTGIKWPF